MLLSLQADTGRRISGHWRVYCLVHLAIHGREKLPPRLCPNLYKTVPSCMSWLMTLCLNQIQVTHVNFLKLASNSSSDCMPACARQVTQVRISATCWSHRGVKKSHAWSAVGTMHLLHEPLLTLNTYIIPCQWCKTVTSCLPIQAAEST